MGGVSEPGINVLAASGQDQAKEPTLPTRGLDLQQVEVILLAFDRTFGTGTSITMGLEEVTVSRDKGMETIVFFGIGVNDATIRRAGTAIGIERTGAQAGVLFGGSQRTTPLDA